MNTASIVDIKYQVSSIVILTHQKTAIILSVVVTG